jgi:hypothetical protein
MLYEDESSFGLDSHLRLIRRSGRQQWPWDWTLLTTPPTHYGLVELSSSLREEFTLVSYESHIPLTRENSPILLF